MMKKIRCFSTPKMDTLLENEETLDAYRHVSICAYMHVYTQGHTHTHAHTRTSKMDILAGTSFYFKHNFYFRSYSRLCSLGSTLK